MANSVAARFVRLNPPRKIKFSQRLDMMKSQWGRDRGWYVEVDGERLAALVDPAWVEMFWASYHVEILTPDLAKRDMMYTQEFWGRDDLVFRDRQFGEIAPLAWASCVAAKTLKEEGRVAMRTLYLPVTCEPWHWAAIKLRRVWRKLRRNREAHCG
jgi:hypothetical protein